VSLSSSDSPSRISSDLRRLPGFRSLATDYVHNFARVAPFFAGDPAEHAAWAAAIARARAHRRRRDDLSRIIAAQQERRQAPSPAREAARALADPASVAIVTGQQAGLFGGPLYTLHKAISAIALAARVSRDHRVRAIPVFWIEAEDHDWDEVRSCTVFDDAFAPHEIALPSELMLQPGPVASVRLDNSVTAALDELERLLPSTEFRSGLVGSLREIYAAGSGMADAFGRWIEHVLGERGLVVYDASDPDAKPLAAEVFARELSSPGETGRLASRAGAELERLGYHAQVQSSDDSPALFLLDGGREPIRAANGRLLAGGQAYSTAELAEQAAEYPALFSPNVLLRPVVQDALFPTICYVAGPNELSYIGQLRGVYERFGVPMPLVYPRASATLVDSGAFRFLTKYQIPLESLQPQDDSALNALVKAQIPPIVDESYSAVLSAVESTMGALIGAVPAIDPTLEGAAKSTLGRIQHDLGALHGKIVQAAKRRDDTLKRQFARTRALVFPAGQPQERTIGFVSFLNQYGPALVDRLMAELSLDPGRHWIIAV
jgi:bacillithiol biosynthesis cysteine-adding enzyme BshC